jgi:hypothetical protein
MSKRDFHWVHRSIEAGVGILLGVGSAYLTAYTSAEHTGEVLIAAVLFLISVVVGEMLVLDKTISELTDSNVRLREAFSRNLKLSVSDLAMLIEKCEVKIRAEDMSEMWSRLCWSVQERYSATNWQRMEGIYTKYWGKSALAIQRSKAKLKDVNIRKVLIVEDEQELKSEDLVLELMEQIDAKIQIHYITRAAIDADPMLNSRMNEVGYDFGIFDNLYVLEWLVDKNRNLKGGRLTMGNAELYQTAFEKLFEASSAYKTPSQ